MQWSSKLGHLAIGAAVGLFSSACAHYQSLKGYDERPMTASVVPLGVVHDPPTQESRPEDDSAGALLEKGFVHFHNSQSEEAAAAFAGAISTGNLNDAGRALAYWHIAESSRQLHDEDRAAEALSSFAVVAQDVLDVRHRRRFAVDEEGDFVSQFRLVRRMAEARGYLSAVWAQRNAGFGRSLDNPIVARSPEEAEYFVRFVAPCSGAPDAQVNREILSEVAGLPVEGAIVQRVTVFCEHAGSNDQFFIVVPLPLSP